MVEVTLEKRAMAAEVVEKAEAAKTKANQAFKDKHYQQAADLYSAAIELYPENAVYWSNRAFAHIRMENFGSALADASRALECDGSYAKAYYRRAEASFALSRFKDAVRDLKSGCRLEPKDAALRRKLAEAEKELMRERFEAALACPENDAWVSDTVDLDGMPVEEDYAGPRMVRDAEGAFACTLPFVEAMVEAFKAGRGVHRRFAYELVLAAQRQLKALPSLVDVSVPEGEELTVCGDVHGQLFDLLRIFELNGRPSTAQKRRYLFNGDFVDRGSWSYEVIMTLMGYAVADPGSVLLTRGNHEAKSMNTIYGFTGEVKAKVNARLVDVFRETFCCLPLAYVLNSQVLVLHGGLFSRDDVTLDDLRAIDRFREPPEEGLMCEALWSDPQPEPGRAPNKRGVGVAFGPDVTKAFLERNGLKLLVRSHEVKDEGYEVAHDGYCVTIFSAPNYCDQMGNKGAFIRFGADMVPKFTQFAAAPHPDVRPMKYAAGVMNGMFGM
ncbi:calcineurin-like phosphoesterase [Helicosporidium sp. ATCC 50920]|nr:calcineurin-like phosphoesterase [Helicosporidium sp. ATCC 50920]|eukprot:KDD75869.1 calcineurin-like phosphoesterase [Helicosporidium sp. ATCC 50920]